MMCNRPDCGCGEIDDTGFCTACDREPLPSGPAASSDGQFPGSGGGSGSGPGSGSRPGGATGSGPGAAPGSGSGSGSGGATGSESGAATGTGSGRATGSESGAATGTGSGRATGSRTRGQAGGGSADRDGGAARGASVGVTAIRPDPWYGLELVDSGRVAEAPAAVTAGPTAVSAGPVPEEHRFCPNPACGRPVGRGHDGEPGRAAGFCADCGTPFDFAQPKGLVIAGRYEVIRVLGSGAYGDAYLAHDRNLETQVALKALNRSVAATAEHERDALVGLRHDAIVRILDYEPDGPHLVLEYLPGEPLSAREGDPLETLLAHGLRMLQALDYLHTRGLLHCDIKPLNIIRFREEGRTGPLDRVRLIDFGAVRSLEWDTGPVVTYTPAYAPPKNDPEHARPTGGFDLYALGMTLREVCRGIVGDRAKPGVDSLMLLLGRATDAGTPGRRFVSARQFGEQLSGVIRQIVAAPPVSRQVTRPSALFGSLTDPLHGGLGVPRPLGDWVRAEVTERETVRRRTRRAAVEGRRTAAVGGRTAEANGKRTAGAAGERSDRQRAAGVLLSLPAPFRTPRPAQVAATLPAPLSDPDDPLPEAVRNALAESRRALRRQDLPAARSALARADLPPWHWLRSWYSGLTALAHEDTATATEHFTQVRHALPGELVPQLALGLCAEFRGTAEDLETARSHYRTVFDTTPALGAAGFGLARVHLLAGRRTEAVLTALRLAEEFRFEREARVAVVRLLVTVVPGPEAAAPTDDDLDRAREAAKGIDVDEAAADGLTAEIQYAEFLRTGDRLKLSEAIRTLGAHAAGERDYFALVDRANQLRPPLVLRWPWRRSGRGHSHVGPAPRTLSF